MTARKKKKAESSSKWSRRVLKRQKLRGDLTKNYTKIDIKHRHGLHKPNECILDELENNLNISGEMNIKTKKSELCYEPCNVQCNTINHTAKQKKSLLRRITRGLFSPVFYFLNLTVAKVNSASNFITRPFQGRRQLEDLEERVFQLEKEVEKLQQFKLKTSQIKNVGSVNTFHQSSILPQLTNMAPPPPPPPPPPPLPPPSTILPTKIRVIRSVKKLENPKKEEKQNNPQITEEILKTVILRKVTSNPTVESDKENIKPSNPGGALVTLSQLKNIKLKKTTSKKVTPRNSLSASKKRKSLGKSGDKKKTPENMFKRRLRQSKILRSPGGTPLMKHDLQLSTGEGITPMLSNALKKKFYYANPLVSPEIGGPSSDESTPTTALKFEKQSPHVLLSPLAM